MAVNSPLDGADYKENDGRIFYASGLDYAPCNGVMDLGEDSTITDRQIDQAVQFFSKSKLPFVWWSEAERLTRKGFAFGGTMKGIALDLATFQPRDLSAPKHLEIRPVTNRKEMAQFNHVLTQSFGFGPPLAKQMEAVLWAILEAQEQLHLIAYVNGAVAAVASLSTGSPIGGIWNGATLPEFRRQGIMTALLQEILLEAKRRQQTHSMAVLMPKGMARTPCTTMGFQDICNMPFHIHGATGALER
jgi:GNAT superfamily N-acetyltransferase